MDNRTRTPAQLYALVVGAVLVAAGILGFFYSAAFGTPGQTGAVLGLLEVNGWHNVVHLASGALLLAVAGKADTARTVVLAFGAVYVLVTILGFVVGDGGAILSIIPINTPDNILHVLLAVSAIGAGLASSDTGTATARA